MCYDYNFQISQPGMEVVTWVFGDLYAENCSSTLCIKKNNAAGLALIKQTINKMQLAAIS